MSAAMGRYMKIDRWSGLNSNVVNRARISKIDEDVSDRPGDDAEEFISYGSRVA